MSDKKIPDTLKLIRRENGEEPEIHRRRGNFLEQNTNGFCSTNETS